MGVAAAAARDGRTAREASSAVAARKGMRAALWRIALRLVKYTAEPKPVRRAEGTVPRQWAAMEEPMPEAGGAPLPPAWADAIIDA